MTALAAALDAGGIPKLTYRTNLLIANPASTAAVQAVQDALANRSQ